MIYTSYFGNIKKIQAKMPQLVLVSIAGKTPDWFDGKKLTRLAPHYDWWKEWKDTYCDQNGIATSAGYTFYTQKYYETVLSEVEQEEIAAELKRLADGKDVCLLCYETPENFCHRQLVAEWLNNAGIACVEWDEVGSQFNWSQAEDDLKKCKDFIEPLQKMNTNCARRAILYHDTEDLEESCNMLEDIKEKAWKTLMDVTY